MGNTCSQRNSIQSVTVAHMEVPCCRGLLALVEEARTRSGKAMPLAVTEISLNGKVLQTQLIT